MSLDKKSSINKGWERQFWTGTAKEVVPPVPFQVFFLFLASVAVLIWAISFAGFSCASV
jgi:hypothetical protein